MRPNGLEMSITGSGVSLRTVAQNKADDLLWEAIEAAIDAGVTVPAFRRRARQFWAEVLNERTRADAAEWDKP